MDTKTITRALTAIALFAFLLKMALQSLTIFENIGKEVFSNRPVIIGFLHLVLLGFISLYLISHIIQARLLPANRITKSRRDHIQHLCYYKRIATHDTGVRDHVHEQ